MKKIIIPLWGISAITLLLYSFTQVDLSLTLSRVSIYQTIERAFQYVGWFNRPLSTYLYLLILGAMFTLYGITLNLARKKAIELKTLWKIIIFLSVILFFAYNAFSYDIFNYIFDAKIITHYHANPYLHKALDYPGDPMLSFMRWTHRTYPYGPFWLVLTVPLSFIGLGYFLLTFYLFKLLMVLSFVGSCFLIARISKKLNIDPVHSVAAFALNPLVLIESLVSAHNDIVMMFFGLLGVYLLVEKKMVNSSLSLIFSVGIKFATGLLFPVFIYKIFQNKSKDNFFYFSVILMVAAVVFATIRSGLNFNPFGVNYQNVQFQPWYLLYVLPFAAFVQRKFFIMIPVFIISLFSLFQYVPFLYLGNWNPPVPTILAYLLYISIALSAVSVAIYAFAKPTKVE